MVPFIEFICFCSTSLYVVLHKQQVSARKSTRNEKTSPKHERRLEEHERYFFVKKAGSIISNTDREDKKEFDITHIPDALAH